MILAVLISTIESYDDCIETEVTLLGTRLETDEEVEARRLRDKEYARKNRERLKANRKDREEADRKEYERLKKKFG